MIDVKMVLRANVSGLGKRGDVVEVSPGYARNFLEPRGLAMKATPGGAAQAESMRRARTVKDTNRTDVGAGADQCGEGGDEGDVAGRGPGT